MAQKKGGGSSRNGRDSRGQRLGVKFDYGVRGKKRASVHATNGETS